MIKKTPSRKFTSSTSWEPASQWYKSIVGEEGHYYHQNIILPGVLRLLDLASHPAPHVLDLGCGSGVLARQLPQTHFTGVDLSASLIKEAKKLDKSPKHQYFVTDAMKQLPLGKQEFSHATIILALQNIKEALPVFQNAYKQLEKGGKFIIVLNHPCFRIPRQSSWDIDNNKKIQFRRLDMYMSPLEIPIAAHPSKGEQSAQLVSYHQPLSNYFHWLRQAGFLVYDMEEWCSDKTSTGGNAKMENRSRKEIPLFLTICAQKI